MLEVKTPTHIGSGEVYTKKDFTYDKRDSSVRVYDPIELFNILGDEYEQFMKSRGHLTGFMISKRNNRLNNAYKYKLDARDNELRGSDNIDMFIKDPYGNPYIPGSSLKGAIRTVVFANLLAKNKSNARYVKNKIRHQRSFETDFFGRINEDVFRFLQISDSKPLSTDDLVIAKKIDVSTKGQTNRLNLAREALKPGTKVEFKMKIVEEVPFKHDQSIKLTADLIRESIELFYESYQKNFLSKFVGYAPYEYGENIIYLGGGAGFATKTVNQFIYGDRTVEEVADYLNIRFRRHQHYKDKGLGVSPRMKKSTYYRGKLMEMGACRLVIKE